MAYWRYYSCIFLNEPSESSWFSPGSKDFYQTPLKNIEKEEKPSGCNIIDPLEYYFKDLKKQKGDKINPIFDNVNLTKDERKKGGLKVLIPKAIEIIVKNRLQPYLNLNFMFLDKSNYLNNPVVQQRLKYVKPDSIIKYPWADIAISFTNNEGSSSLVGYNSKKQAIQGKNSMNFSWFNVRTIMHEFGHSLGLLHEHQNPKKGIEWNSEKIYKWTNETQGWDKRQTDINILNKYKVDQTNGTDFDDLSMMKYGYPAEFTLNNQEQLKCEILSTHDVQFLTCMYAPTDIKLNKGNKTLSMYNFYDYDISVENFLFNLKIDEKLTPSQFLNIVYSGLYKNKKIPEFTDDCGEDTRIIPKPFTTQPPFTTQSPFEKETYVTHVIRGRPIERSKSDYHILQNYY
jgi:Astacin (Peptidase family M12A)